MKSRFESAEWFAAIAYLVQGGDADVTASALAGAIGIAVEHEGTCLLPVSTRSPEALKPYLRRYRSYLEHSSGSVPLQDICYSASMHRSHQEYRLALTGTSADQLIERIDTTIFVANAPAYAWVGVGAEGWLSQTIAGPTGEGVTDPRTWTRQRMIAVGGSLRVV